MPTLILVIGLQLTAALAAVWVAGKADLAWLGGFTFVQARLRTKGGVTPIVQRAEDEKFTSKFIVPAGSAARSLADLKGKTFVSLLREPRACTAGAWVRRRL